MIEAHMQSIVAEVANERRHQAAKKIGGDTDQFDKGNTRNDWIAYIARYLGECADKMEYRCSLGGVRKNMVRIAALAVACIEAIELGYIEEKNDA